RNDARSHGCRILWVLLCVCRVAVVPRPAADFSTAVQRMQCPAAGAPPWCRRPLWVSAGGGGGPDGRCCRTMGSAHRPVAWLRHVPNVLSGARALAVPVLFVLALGELRTA